MLASDCSPAVPWLLIGTWPLHGVRKLLYVLCSAAAPDGSAPALAPEAAPAAAPGEAPGPALTPQVLTASIAT
jgi:hypothetical protein